MIKSTRKAKRQKGDNLRGLSADSFGEEADMDLLERETIEAILEHRRLIAEADAADERVRRAEEAMERCPETLSDLKARSLRLRVDLAAHQLALNDLLNQLGYIPSVPLSPDQVN